MPVRRSAFASPALTTAPVFSLKILKKKKRSRNGAHQLIAIYIFLARVSRWGIRVELRWGVGVLARK